eukprot:TRINITY_DN10521_c0_g2_i1.p1 TRINITY_DN10521_c0_g2~~TRINITY_DN10521_c0_g2_i1.p1  ORF type:complete len:217 (-),score=49.41 TRINITY_DN10521_c0_g2_i1:473-1075(-)
MIPRTTRMRRKSSSDEEELGSAKNPKQAWGESAIRPKTSRQHAFNIKNAKTFTLIRKKSSGKKTVNSDDSDPNEESYEEDVTYSESYYKKKIKQLLGKLDTERNSTKSLRRKLKEVKKELKEEAVKLREENEVLKKKQKELLMLVAELKESLEDLKAEYKEASSNCAKLIKERHTIGGKLSAELYNQIQALSSIVLCIIP